MHRSYGLQGSLKRRYKHPSLLPSMGTTRQKSSCRNGLQNGPHSLLRMKVGTTRLCQQDRTQRLTRRNRGLPDRAAITTLGAFRTFTNIPGPGVRTANFAAFGSWPGVRSRRTQRACGAAMRLCASLIRGVAAPLGCVIFFVSAEIGICTSGAHGFPRVRGGGGITTLGVLCVLLKRWTAACQSG